MLIATLQEKGLSCVSEASEQIACAWDKRERRLRLRITVVALIAVTLLIICVAQGQETEPPKLKESVELRLTRLQRDLARIEIQARIVQESYAKTKAQYDAALASALADSGLDPDVYTLNPDTLSVLQRPGAPEVGQ